MKENFKLTTFRDPEISFFAVFSFFSDEEYSIEEGDESIYEAGGREVLAEDDEISPEEEAFLKGYEEAIDDEQ